MKKNIFHFFSNSKCNPFVIGIGLLAVPTFSILIVSLLFICGLSVNPFVFPLSLILSLLLMYFVQGKNHKEFLVSVTYHLLIIAFSIIVSVLIYDYSYDGLAYHQEAIFYLKNGWNPIYEHLPSNATFAIWVEHYAKGMETISATLYSTTGNIEAGKAVNFILIFASAFLFFYFLKTYYGKLSFKKKILLTFLFTLCPVVVVQILTFYIDFAAYSLLLILVPSLICFLQGDSKYDIYIICFVVVLSATIKFNLFFWVLFILFLYTIYAIVLKKYQLLKKMINVCVLSGIFSVFVAGFNPYVTNTIDHKNPFYPLMGTDRVDIMTGLANPNFFQKSRFEKVIISLFSLPNNSKNEEIKLALPHFLKTSHFERYASVDTRIGGFGIFFSWIFILSLILLIVDAFSSKKGVGKNKKPIYCFLGILFASLFVLPHAWVARYFPFFYAFPLIILLYSECATQSRVVKVLKSLIYLLLMINTVLFCGAVSVRGYLHKTKVNKSINTLAKSNNPILIYFGNNVGLKIKLDKRNIPYEATQEELGTQLTIVGSPYGSFDSTKYIEKNNILIEKKQ